jgi:hypothetical protein
MEQQVHLMLAGTCGDVHVQQQDADVALPQRRSQLIDITVCFSCMNVIERENCEAFMI